MPPSPTVENYLKAIFHAQAEGEAGRLVPLGQLAAMLGVVPGTATAMVKTLAESELVHYEPYLGCRLTPAGQKLAARVLRRHRLIELFLVRELGMSWTEVHDEAEQLEHAVSDRLIDRIDEILGRPAVDPHGDPIPGPEGTVDQPDYQTLLTCPLQTPVVVGRITDQDAEFLRFIEENDLKPGQTLEVEARDSLADSVQVKGQGSRRITIGARAASKLLVQLAQAVLLVVLGAWTAAAQTPPAAGSSRPFEILDNSFLVEEAFNQEAGVFQNILTMFRGGEAWDVGFTQEWPLGTQRHQLSYPVPFAGTTGVRGLGDVMINYRYQALTETASRPAFSPRISIILPSGDEHRGLGTGRVGWQMNLPVSKQCGDFYVHANGGATWLRAAIGLPPPGGGVTSTTTLLTPHLSASVIRRLKPMLNALVEAVFESTELSTGTQTTLREGTFTLSPGARGGWNLGDHQLVLGVAVPVTWAGGTSETGVFGYFSYELPFQR
jgi:DtxR family Mn-dependent transcriptional regulator